MGALTWPQVQLDSLRAHLGGGGTPGALVAEGSVLQDGDTAGGELDVIASTAVSQEVGVEVAARGRLCHDLRERDRVV